MRWITIRHPLARPVLGSSTLLLCVWLWPQIGTGQQPAPPNGPRPQSTRHTLDEYFLAIPDTCLPLLPRARRRALLRPAHIAVRDERNGYLQIAGDGARPTVTVAKFRKRDGTYLIAVTADYEMGSQCWLFDGPPGRFVDVTRDLIPDHRNCDDFESLDCHVYELPRYGTTIVVKDAQGRERYRLGWQDDRFKRLP